MEVSPARGVLGMPGMNDSLLEGAPLRWKGQALARKPAAAGSEPSIREKGGVVDLGKLRN